MSKKTSAMAEKSGTHFMPVPIINITGPILGSDYNKITQYQAGKLSRSSEQSVCLID